MKIYISADIEGVTGVTDWDETEKDKAFHREYAEFMTREVVSACQGAFAAGADEVYIKDAHDSARNIVASMLPEKTVLIRGWSERPDSMMEGLDESFDAAVFIGYHTGAGFDGNPLSHTMATCTNHILLNGKKTTEFEINAYFAASRGVPVVFVSGDYELCIEAEKTVPGIEVCATKKGLGNATFNRHIDTVCREIKEGTERGIRNREMCKISVPDDFIMEINFKDCYRALRASYYPGAFQSDQRTAAIRCNTIDEIMAAIMFML